MENKQGRGAQFIQPQWQFAPRQGQKAKSKWQPTDGTERLLQPAACTSHYTGHPKNRCGSHKVQTNLSSPGGVANCPLLKPKQVINQKKKQSRDLCLAQIKVQWNQISALTKLKFSEMFKNSCLLGHFSHVQLFATLWTVAHQDSLEIPLLLGFSRQEYWSELPCPPPGDLPNPGIYPVFLMSPTLVGRFFTISTTWKAQIKV